MRRVIVESPFAPQTVLPAHPWTSRQCTCSTYDSRDAGYGECLFCKEYDRVIKMRAEERVRNARYLSACLRDCILRGESPYASHGLLTREGVLRDDVSEERAQGITAGFAWREVANATVFYIDLGWSCGMRAGEEDAKNVRDKLSGTLTDEHVIEYRELGPDWDRK